jgi:hypothetical protein
MTSLTTAATRSPIDEITPEVMRAARGAFCSLWRDYDGADHAVLIGEATGLDRDIERDPLRYHRGFYPRAQWRAA